MRASSKRDRLRGVNYGWPSGHKELQSLLHKLAKIQKNIDIWDHRTSPVLMNVYQHGKCRLMKGNKVPRVGNLGIMGLSRCASV